MNLNQFTRAGALALSLAFLGACGGRGEPDLPALDHDVAAKADAAFASFSTVTDSDDPMVTADLRYGIVDVSSVQECLNLAVLGISRLGEGTTSNVACFNTAVSTEPVAVFSCEEQARDADSVTVRCEREGTNPKTFTVTNIVLTPQ